jgi:conjugal transfer pilus assembly protein TraD
VLREVHPDRPPTLREVVAVMEPNHLRHLLRALEPDRAAVADEYLAGLTRDALSAIRGLGTRLAVIDESHTGEFLGGGPAAIDLPAALEGREVVLFSLNSGRYGKLSAQLGTLAVQDLIAAAGRRLESGSRLPATVGIDEFSALGADNVLQLLARGRESGISVLLATQELADLDRAARGLRDQVLGNTALKLAHRQDVPASAQTVAELGGTVKRWDRTYRASGNLIAEGLLGGGGGGPGTRRLVDRYIVEPNTIKTLRTGELVRIRKTPEAHTHIVRVAAPRRPDELER